MLLISADPPRVNAQFALKLGIPFRLLSDEDHAIADRYQVHIMRVHPAATRYKDGFIQPAMFAYRGEQCVHEFIQRPNLLNLFGAARRPTPAELIEEIRGGLKLAD